MLQIAAVIGIEFKVQGYGILQLLKDFGCK